MAQYLHIRCVVRPTEQAHMSDIQSVGESSQTEVVGYDPGQGHFTHPRRDPTRFYIEKSGGLRLDVIVATSAHGNYLRRSPIESSRTSFCLCRPVLDFRRNV